MKASHENEWDELRMVDWVYDVLLKQRDAVPHLQRIIIRFWAPFYDDLWQEDERWLQAKCEEIGIILEFVNDELSRDCGRGQFHSLLPATRRVYSFPIRFQGIVVDK